MSTANKLEEEIVSYLTRLDEDQKRTVLALVKTFVEEEDYDHWKDPSFVAEMDARYNDMKTGKVKALTKEELMARLRKLKDRRK